jgi:hypothetical protein
MSPHQPAIPPGRHGESGNVIVFILMAVVLIGIVTAAIRSGGDESANIDNEQLAIRTSEIRQYASELERGITFIMNNGVSENDLRFAIPSPATSADEEYGDIDTHETTQLFSRKGGGAAYRPNGAGVQVAPARWEFYGYTALPQVGSERADLVAVLPDVTPEFCAAINRTNNYDGQPLDDGTCVDSGMSHNFDDDEQFTDDGSQNTMDTGSFSSFPAAEGCVKCDDGKLYYFHVLMKR